MGDFDGDSSRLTTLDIYYEAKNFDAKSRTCATSRRTDPKILPESAWAQNQLKNKLFDNRSVFYTLLNFLNYPNLSFCVCLQRSRR
jgi:hypothetical protein